MKKKYNVPSERYGHIHSFVRIENSEGTNEYVFVPEKDWMPIYVTGDGNGGVAFVDTEGGPCIGVGFKTDEVEVVELKSFGNTQVFVLKEIGD